MILFCLPYAGGSEVAYYKWKKYLDPSIQLKPIELKGRGKRCNEFFYENLDDAVEDILTNIKDKIMYYDYAVYGHSMGGLLAYELYYRIGEQNLNEPKHIFFSGNKPPSISSKRENIHTLPDDEFIKKIIGLGGTPNEIANNRDLLEIFLPIIRSDFKIIENYTYRKREEKIKCDISVLYGKEDSIDLEEILSWESHVEGRFRVYGFEGNHFFLNDNIENIVNFINKTLIK